MRLRQGAIWISDEVGNVCTSNSRLVCCRISTGEISHIFDMNLQAAVPCVLMWWFVILNLEKIHVALSATCQQCCFYERASSVTRHADAVGDLIFDEKNTQIISIINFYSERREQRPRWWVSLIELSNLAWIIRLKHIQLSSLIIWVSPWCALSDWSDRISNYEKKTLQPIRRRVSVLFW